MSRPTITFTSDFGTLDGYVGAVWGAILSICPEVRMVNISHAIPPQDIAHAAFTLHTATRYYPAGTVHLAVVDPAVGTSRRGLCVVTKDYMLVGPDNGIFTPFMNEDSAIYSLENEKCWRSIISNTFHGRDIFGPVAGHLTAGFKPEELGPKIDDPFVLDTWTNRWRKNEVEGAVVHVDHFGNCITSLTPEDVAKFSEMTLWLPGNPNAPEAHKICLTYAEANLGEACWLLGSAGLIELAVNGGNAAEMFGIERGDRILVEFK